MSKLSIIILMAAAVCSCYGIPDRRTVRSVSEDVSVNKANPITFDIGKPENSNAAKSVDEFTGNSLNQP